MIELLTALIQKSKIQNYLIMNNQLDKNSEFKTLKLKNSLRQMVENQMMEQISNNGLILMLIINYFKSRE